MTPTKRAPASPPIRSSRTPRARTARPKAFVVHRLVQDFARRAMTEERRGEALREALGWVNAAFVGDPDDVRSWPVLDPLAPHALAVARRADEAGIAEPTGGCSVSSALLFNAKARYAEAEPLYAPRARRSARRRFGPDDPRRGDRPQQSREPAPSTNRLAEAEPLYRRALAIGETSLGPDHPQVASVLNNLAQLLRATNRLAEAEPLYRRALAIDEASYGPDHPEVATDLNNLAELLHDTNRLGEAEPLYRRALAIYETSYGPDHPASRDRASTISRACSEPRTASPRPSRSIAARSRSTRRATGRIIPMWRPTSTISRTLLRDTNRLAEAEPLYRRALKIDEASYGPDHPEVAADLNNLAILLRDTNRLGEAEPLYRRALAIWRKEPRAGSSASGDRPQQSRAFPQTDEPTRRGRAALSPRARHPRKKLRAGSSRRGEEPRYPRGPFSSHEPPRRGRAALSPGDKIAEKGLGPDHPSVAISLSNFAGLLLATNRLAEAEALFRRALKIDETSYGPDHPNVAIRLNNLASLFYATNRLAEAEPLVRRSLPIFETSLGPDHPTTATVRRNLAALLAALGKGA